MSPMPLAIVLAALIVITARPGRPMRALPTPPNEAPPPSVEHRPAVRTRRPHSDDAADIASWCESLSRAVRGGDALLLALRDVDPPSRHGATIAMLNQEVERTGHFGVRRHDTSPHMTLALTVVAAVLEHGGQAAEPLDRAAAVLRARAAEHAERQVQSAQARLSAQVMSLLPIAVLALLLGTSVSVRSAVATPAGILVVSTGIALNAAGWHWMRRIIRRSAR